MPEWSASLTADYELDVAGGWSRALAVAIVMSVNRARRVVTIVNNLSYTRPSYSAVDLYSSVSYDNWTFRLFAKNVTDQRAYVGGGAATDGFNMPYGIEVAVLQPRTARYQCRCDFLE